MMQETACTPGRAGRIGEWDPENYGIIPDAMDTKEEI